MKISNKMILQFIKPFIDRYERKVNKTRGKNPLVKYGEFKTSSGGVLWSGDKEIGKLYHAYCYGDLLFTHGYKEGFFEDCIQGSHGKAENAKEARKKGWIIGIGAFKDIPICPECVKKINCILTKRNG